MSISNCLFFHYHIENHTVTKLLPDTYPTPPMSMVVIQATTKGVSVPIPHGRSPGADTLTPHGSLTRLAVLQVNPTPLTPGPTPVPDHWVTNLTTPIVTYVL